MIRRPWIDLLRDGAQAADLAAGYDLGVSRVLGVSALGALNSGYTRPRWEQEVLDPRSYLGRQVRLDRRNKPRTARAVARLLGAAWERAEQQAEKSPRWNAETARAEAASRARLLRDLAADDAAPLTDAPRAILAHLADEAQRLGSTVVNAPWRSVVDATGCTERAVKYWLPRLVEVGLLALAERGRPRGSRSKAPPRANAFRLPDAEAVAAYLCRETRQVGPMALTGGTHADKPSGTHPLTGGTQARPNPTEETTDMDHITLKREQIVEALGEAALAALEAAQQERRDAEVRHLRPVEEVAR